MDCIKSDRDTLLTVANEFFTDIERLYYLNDDTELIFEDNEAIIQNDEGCTKIRYDSKSIEMTEKDGCLKVRMTFCCGDDVREVMCEEIKEGLSYGTVAEYYEEIESMEDSIDEYIDNGLLIDDFPVFKEKITICLDKMESIYKANSND